ncbi:MAG TPA: NnrS family protein [Gammaproteobacteria bacterium]
MTARTTASALRAAGGAPFWSYGFRPFFTLASAAAVAAMVALGAALLLGAWPAQAPPVGRWHGHEMLFGFVAAAIAGFLLTAVPTWTSTEPVRGARLAALAGLWLVGRLVMLPWLGLDRTPLVLLDAAFFPALGLAVGAALLRTRNARNYPFLALLALLTAADLVYAAAHLGWSSAPPFDPLRLAANVVLLMVGVIGGRIVPLFTRNALVRAGIPCEIPARPWLDRASLAALVAVLVVDAWRPDGAAAAVAAAVAAALLAARLARWHGHRALGMPIVWILHVGYGWLALALALKAVWMLAGAAWAANWLHAQTAGAFGTMILGVMSRVALGHTGRPLVVAPAITAAYLLVIAGALLRVFGPVALPQHLLAVLGGAATLWALGFAVFLVIYLPMLVAPRADAPGPLEAQVRAGAPLSASRGAS